MSTIHADLSTDRFLGYLVGRACLSDLSAERVRRVQEETMERLASVLLKLGMLSEEDLAAELAAFSGFPLVDASESLHFAENASIGIAESFLRAHELVPLTADELGVTIACWDPLDDYAVRALNFACERPITWTLATHSQSNRRSRLPTSWLT